MRFLFELAILLLGLGLIGAGFHLTGRPHVRAGVYSFFRYCHLHPINRVVLATLVVVHSTRHYGPQVWAIVKINPFLAAFLALATFKGLKITAHTISFYFFTRPAQIPLHPTLFPRDVTVIIPTVGTLDAEFKACITSILANDPAQVIVSTVGTESLQRATAICEAISQEKVKVVSVEEANKRQQLMRAIDNVRSPITVYSDESVTWPDTYLRSSLAPFEDPQVGLIGTAKRVRRDRSGGLPANMLNYIGCIYLERHNFECTVSSNIDGGVFVISGRTALTRTKILQSSEFRNEYLNECWSSPFQTVGPMKVDDDNCITRFMVNNGWKTVFHNKPDAIMHTVLGDKGTKKFHGQLLRWVRTTWRSNTTSLFIDRVCWRSQPWTTYAMFISSFVNFALFYDIALILTLIGSGHGNQWWVLALLLFATKTIKPLPHFLREPRDLIFLPIGILFGYVHSFYKLYALFTVSNIEWCGREGIKATG